MRLSKFSHKDPAPHLPFEELERKMSRNVLISLIILVLELALLGYLISH